MSSKTKTKMKKKKEEEERTKGSLSMQEEMSRDSSETAAAAAAVVVADSVDPRRKHQLLLEARADRLRWIQSIPLPYATSMLLSSNTNNSNNNNSSSSSSSSTTTANASTSTATTAMTTPGGNLLPLTHAGKHLQSIEPILLQLYGSQQTAKEHVQELIPEPTESSYNLAVPSGNEVLEEAIHHNDVSICDQATLEAYRRFLNQLQSPSSAALANGIRTFCRKLTTVVTDANPAQPQALAKSLQTYVDSTMETIQTLWTSTTNDNNNNNSNTTTTTTSTAVLRPSLESFVYGQCFPSIWSTVRDDAQDKECAFRCQSLSFLEPKHLDVACLKDTNDLPILCLLSVDAFFSPQSKLHRILETYRGVNETLQKALNAKDDKGEDDGSSDNNKAADATKLPSADDVLPTLILTVLHAEPQSIVSNLRFVEMFCTAEQLRGEAGYAFTNLYGAVQFILDLNLDSPSTTLTISPEEFVKGVEECRVKAEAKMKEITSSLQGAAAAVPPPPTENAVDISVQAVREARQRGEVVDMDWARRWMQQQQTGSVDIVSSPSLPAAGQDSTEQPLQEALPPGFVRNYTFLAARPEDIHMTELPQLLDEYRMLAKTVELLLGERAARLATERKRRLKKAQRAIEENALAAGVSLDHHYHHHHNQKKETVTTPVRTAENPTVETVTND